VTRFISHLAAMERREEIDFGLIVLDTYLQCIAGADENSQAVASKASSNMIRIRRELATSVVYVHHTGKDASRGMRGSDALRANTDCAVEVTRDEEGKAATVAAKTHHQASASASTCPISVIERRPRMSASEMPSCPTR
jgi:RecA-family ATPase